MTTCIAVACHEGQEPRIVLCADSRLDGAWEGVSDSAVKIQPLGHGWCVLLAGEWFNASNLAEMVRGKWKNAALPPSKAVAVRQAKAFARPFKNSALFKPNFRVELIIAGFIDNAPVILLLSMDEAGAIEVSEQYAYAAAGSGGGVARVFLAQRQCDPFFQVQAAAYVAYEAKRYSEIVSSVGKETYLGWISPVGSDGSRESKVLYQAGIDYFEGILSDIALRPIPTIDLANVMLRTPSRTQDPSRSIGESSPPQPSLALPAATDES